MWSEYLQMFDFDWQYRPGKTNPADSLSRLVTLKAIRTNNKKSRVARISKVNPYTERDNNAGIGYESNPVFGVPTENPPKWMKSLETITSQTVTELALPLNQQQDPEILEKQIVKRALQYAAALQTFIQGVPAGK